MTEEFRPSTREYNLGASAGGRSVGFGQAVKWAFQRYFQFSGRSQRAEYWWFVLFTVIGGIIASIFDGALGFGADGGPLNGVFTLATFIPGLALGWRRMHDIGRSGWWFLLPYGVIVFAVVAIATTALSGSGSGAGIVGIVLVLAALGSAIFVLVLLCTDSDPQANRFGPSPKYPSQADVFS